jgi:hypothetical protein
LRDNWKKLQSWKVVGNGPTHPSHVDICSKQKDHSQDQDKPHARHMEKTESKNFLGPDKEDDFCGITEKNADRK